jgi:hypothetical protein
MYVCVSACLNVCTNVSVHMIIIIIKINKLLSFLPSIHFSVPHGWLSVLKPIHFMILSDPNNLVCLSFFPRHTFSYNFPLIYICNLNTSPQLGTFIHFESCNKHLTQRSFAISCETSCLVSLHSNYASEYNLSSHKRHKFSCHFSL